MKGLTILVFAFNEQKNIHNTLKIIYSCIKKTNIKFEIIVLNDGSIDDTNKIVDNFKKFKKEVKSYNFKKNRGLTEILKFGIKKSKFDKLTWFPGDNSFLKFNLTKFFKMSLKFDLVNGYRDNKNIFDLKRLMLTKLNQLFLSLLFDQNIKDVHGLFIFQANHLRKIKFYCERYSIMVEILPALLNKYNYAICQIPIRVNYKTIENSSTLSLQTIINFVKTWIKSLFYFKLSNSK